MTTPKGPSDLRREVEDAAFEYERNLCSLVSDRPEPMNSTAYVDGAWQDGALNSPLLKVAIEALEEIQSCYDDFRRHDRIAERALTRIREAQEKT